MKNLCMICNQYYTTRAMDVKFFWNDENFQALPVCDKCIKLLSECYILLNFYFYCRFFVFLTEIAYDMPYKGILPESNEKIPLQKSLEAWM